MQDISLNALATRWDAYWQSGATAERFIIITDEGLKLGTTILAKYNADGLLALDEKRIRNLLLVAFGYAFPEKMLHKIRCAERALKQHGAAMMHIHFALAGFHPLESVGQMRNLFCASAMMESGVSHERILKSFGLDKFNPYHRPGGRPDGGQFISANEAGSSDNSADSKRINETLLPALAIVAATETMGASLAIEAVLAEEIAMTAEEGAATARNTQWIFGKFKSAQKWQNQMSGREWTEREITDTIKVGTQDSAPNYVNKGSLAIRYTNPDTGKFVVRDEITKEILQVSKKGFQPNKFPSK